MIIENNDKVAAIIHQAEADIKAITGCEIHIAIDAFEIRANNKDVLKQIICNYYDVTWERIVSRKRPRELSDAMFIYVYIARKMLRCTFKEIGRDCGNRDHATAINAMMQINNYLQTNDSRCYDLKVIQKKFKENMI